MPWSPNRILGAVIGVLAIATIATLALTIGQNVKTYDPDSPEGVAQAYLTAAFNRNFDKAAAFFAPDSECDASDLDRAFIQDSVRISFAGMSGDAERSTVRITADIPGGGRFGGSYEEQHSLRLVFVNDEWKLTGIPWPLYDCGPPKTSSE